MSRFNEKLYNLRIDNRLTQEQLAEELSVSRTLIVKWEKGESYPNIELISRISKFFGVPISKLLSGEKIAMMAQEIIKQ